MVPKRTDLRRYLSEISAKPDSLFQVRFETEGMLCNASIPGSKFSKYVDQDGKLRGDAIIADCGATLIRGK
ncbi:MAG: hypothetical protein IJT16_12010 [Lachnospiraceae bacterium]|nr:hypothetical protein [Lachnospiraceae bacterium]